MRHLFLLLYLVVFLVIVEYFDTELLFGVQCFFIFKIIVVLVFWYFYKEEDNLNQEQSITHYVLVLLFGLSVSFLNGIIYLNREWMLNGVEIYEGFSTYTLLNIVLFSPILEELIYRKYWYAFLGNKGKNKIWNMIFISIVFSLAHWYTETPLILPFIASLFLFWIYNLTTNILLCIVCHIFMNSGVFIIPYLLTPNFEQITIITTVFIFLGCVLLFNKVLKKKKVGEVKNI